MKSLILACLTLTFTTFFSLAEETYDVRVTVTNIPGVKGNLLVGLYDSDKAFLKDPHPNSPKIKLTSTDSVTATISGVKPGVYAVSVIQDLNGNGKLDKSFLGMPKEPLAFSVIKEIPRGKPKFEACTFEVKDGDVTMTIPLVTEE